MKHVNGLIPLPDERIAMTVEAVICVVMMKTADCHSFKR